MNKPKKKRAFLIVGSIIALLTAASIGLYLAFCFSPEFADGFNQSVAQLFRRVLSKITSIFPFSLGEWLVLCTPVIFVIFVYGAVRFVKGSFRRLGSYLLRVLSAICVIFCLFVWTLAPGYRATGIDKKLDLDRKAVSEIDLLRAGLVLTDQLNELSERLVSDEKGATIMPYSFGELNDRLVTAYEDFVKKEPIFTTYPSKVKPVFASQLLSYSHITGIYSFFTGEANLNIDFPDYTLPFTMAHELAHQRGVSREDEANFVAYLVCIGSEDEYIRYSATLSLWEYMMNAVYQTNRKYYSLFFNVISDTVKKEEAAYAEFFKQYEHSNLAKVNDYVNDSYLKSQGAEEGNRSYNLVVDLTVAYFKAEKLIPR